MGKEETVESIGSEVAKEFGEERIKNIEYFGHYECGDLNVRVRVEGLTDRDGFGTKFTYSPHASAAPHHP